jgi:hypothetical protein
MANKFYQFCVTDSGNMMTLASYISNAQRLYGIQRNDIASSSLHNRIFYQLSTMTSALGGMMSAKGYDMNDESLSTLQANLAKIMTQYDLDSVYMYAKQSWVQSYVSGVIANYYTASQVNLAISSAVMNLSSVISSTYMRISSVASADEIINASTNSKFISPISLAQSVASAQQIIDGYGGYRYMITTHYLTSRATVNDVLAGTIGSKFMAPDVYQNSKASPAEINAGTVTNKFISPAYLKASDYATKTYVTNAIAGDLKATDFTGSGKQSLSTNGYQKLPGGLTFQWGYYSANVTKDQQVNVVFPIGFSTVFSFVVMDINNAGNTSCDMFLQLKTLSLSSAVVLCQRPGSVGDKPLNGFYWMAIGVA